MMEPTKSLNGWMRKNKSMVEVRGIEPLTPACKAGCCSESMIAGTQARIRSESHPSFLPSRGSDFDNPGACLPDYTLIAWESTTSVGLKKPPTYNVA